MHIYTLIVGNGSLKYLWNDGFSSFPDLSIQWNLSMFSLPQLPSQSLMSFSYYLILGTLFWKESELLFVEVRTKPCSSISPGNNILEPPCFYSMVSIPWAKDRKYQNLCIKWSLFPLIILESFWSESHCKELLNLMERLCNIGIIITSVGVKWATPTLSLR